MPYATTPTIPNDTNATNATTTNNPTVPLELREKIQEYGNFITQTLQPQLKAAVEAKEEVERDISEYIQLRNQIRLIIERDGGDANDGGPSSMTPIKVIANLAHGAIFCRATIPNPRTIYLLLGLGFHVEMTLTEAVSFIGKRLDHLEKVLQSKEEVAKKVAEDVEQALELLEEFGGENFEFERD